MKPCLVFTAKESTIEGSLRERVGLDKRSLWDCTVFKVASRSRCWRVPLAAGFLIILARLIGELSNSEISPSELFNFYLMSRLFV